MASPTSSDPLHGVALPARVHARAVRLLRWPILLCWLVGSAWLVHDGVPSFGRDGLSLRELAPADAPELATELESVRLFRIPLTAREQVVRHDPGGVSRTLQQADVTAAVDASRATAAGNPPEPAIAFQLPYVNTLGAFPASSESSTTVLLNLVGNPDSSLHARERAAKRVAEQARERGPGDVHVTGGIPAQLQTGRIIRGSLDPLQLASIVVLVLITLAWFRSLAPPLIVLATIGTTMLVLLEVLAALAARTGVAVPAEVLPVVLVVAIGVATDYALFHIAAWRRLVERGSDPVDATLRAIATTSPVVMTAGITTALGATSLLLARTAFIRAFAPALVASVVVAMLIGMVLVPALVAAFGPRLAWPRSPESLRGRVRLTRRLAALLGRPVVATLVVVVTVAGLVVLGLEARSAPTGFNVVTGLPDDDPVSIGARDAAAGFAPGILSPTLLVVDGERLDERESELAAFSDAAAKLDGVAGVLGPDVVRATIERAGLGDEAALLQLELLGAGTQGSGSDEPGSDATGSSSDDDQVDAPIPAPRAAAQVMRESARGVLVTTDGRHARLVVVLDADAYTGTAVQVLDRLRPELRTALDDAGLADSTLRIAGDTAVVERVVDELDHDLLRIAAFLVPFEIMVLLVFLRSIRMSLVVVASSLVTTAAALGALAVYDRTWGVGDGITFFVPVATFVLLLSIGADYGVLMGSSIRRARDEGREGLAAARAGIRDAAPSIVLAGLVLASTFALLAIVDLESFRQIAVALGVGVLLDTLLVRPVVMPLALAGIMKRQGKDDD
ncbi:MAG: MMPL family transporter [Thermoleophilia bacterium]|nr:MMPL family transporter [Thermoleophilia bacterium]